MAYWLFDSPLDQEATCDGILQPRAPHFSVGIYQTADSTLDMELAWYLQSTHEGKRNEKRLTVMKTGFCPQISIAGEQYLEKQGDCSGNKLSGEIVCNIHIQERKIQAVAWTEFL